MEEKQQYFQKAIEAFERSKYDIAEDAFSKVIDFDPGFLEAYVMRAQVRMQTGHDKGAVEDLTKAIELDPGMGWIFLLRAHAFRSLHQYDRALEDANRSIQLDPDDADAYALKGWLFFKSGWFSNALEFFHVYFQRNPKDKWINKLYDVCRKAVNREICPICNDVYACNRCKERECGLSADMRPEKMWKEKGWKCPYEHCVNNFPKRRNSEAFCEFWEHDCPGGADQLQVCAQGNKDSFVDSETGIKLLDISESITPIHLLKYFITVTTVAVGQEKQVRDRVSFGVTAETEEMCLNYIDKYLHSKNAAIREVEKIDDPEINKDLIDILHQAKDVEKPGFWYIG